MVIKLPRVYIVICSSVLRSVLFFFALLPRFRTGWGGRRHTDWKDWCRSNHCIQAWCLIGSFWSRICFSRIGSSRFLTYFTRQILPAEFYYHWLFYYHPAKYIILNFITIYHPAKYIYIYSNRMNRGRVIGILYHTAKCILNTYSHDHPFNSQFPISMTTSTTSHCLQARLRIVRTLNDYKHFTLAAILLINSWYMVARAKYRLKNTCARWMQWMHEESTGCKRRRSTPT